MKLTTKALRRACRIENAQIYQKQKQEIMDAKLSYTALFHKLVKKQRGKLGTCVNELYVGDEVYKTETKILCGRHKYFEQLAKKTENSLFDEKYSVQVKNELLEIIDICEKGNTRYSQLQSRKSKKH